jgi:hypothetical protein
MMPFTLDPEALADAAREEHEHFRPPSFDGFSDLVFAYPENRQELIEDDTLARVYVDALLDLHALVDEYRFEALLAAALLSDYRAKLENGEAEPLMLSEDPRMDQMPWPAETVVVMRRYARDPPSPSILFEDPHRQIAGSRIFSRWVAGQMIDSALYRGIAACDRLAIMLHCGSGIALPQNAKGELRAPSFRRDDLKPLGRYFASSQPGPRSVSSPSITSSLSSKKSATASRTTAGVPPSFTARRTLSTAPCQTVPSS